MPIRETAEPCFLSLYSTPTPETKRGPHTVIFSTVNYYPDSYFHWSPFTVFKVHVNLIHMSDWFCSVLHMLDSSKPFCLVVVCVCSFVLFHYCGWVMLQYGLLWWLSGKEFACNAGDPGSIPVSGRSPREGNGNPLQYSCLENSMGREARWATAHGVTKSQTWPSD